MQKLDSLCIFLDDGNCFLQPLPFGRFLSIYSIMPLMMASITPTVGRVSVGCSYSGCFRWWDTLAGFAGPFLMPWMKQSNWPYWMNSLILSWSWMQSSMSWSWSNGRDSILLIMVLWSRPQSFCLGKLFPNLHEYLSPRGVRRSVVSEPPW